MKHKLNEALTDIVFYYTSIHNAFSIFKQGKINLTPSIRNQSEEETGNGKFYFLSLTRSRRGSYHVNSGQGVLMALDGRKLQQRYGGKAVDYWNMYDKKGIIMKDEMEDRLFTNDPTIDIIPYIKDVSIMVSKHNTRANNYIIPIYTILRKKGISVSVYDNSDSWLNNKKSDALTLEQIKHIKTDPIEGRPYVSPSQFRRSPILAVIELFHKTSKESLSEDGEKMRRKLRSMDFVKSVGTDIHNDSGSGGKGATPAVQKLVMLMRKNNFKTFQQLADHLQEKWKKIEDESERKDFYRRNKKRIDSLLAVMNGTREFIATDYSTEDDMAPTVIKNTLIGMYLNDIKIDQVRKHYPELSTDIEKHKGFNIIDDIVRDITNN